MALSVVNQWDATSGPIVNTDPIFGNQSFTVGPVDLEQKITPTPGNWLIAIVTWVSLTPACEPYINVCDPSRNVWHLLTTRTVQASTTTVFSSNLVLNAQVWACPAVAYAGWNVMHVYTAIQAIAGLGLGSVAVKLLEVAGMGNGFLTVDSVTPAIAANSSTLTLNAPAPAGGADCLMIAAATTSIAYNGYTTTGTGWTQLGSLTNTNPNHGMTAAWREGTSASSVTFTLTGGPLRNWSGVVVAIRQTGTVPVLPNPNWPLLEYQVGFGFSQTTPPASVYWTTVPGVVPSGSTKRGMEYDLGTAQAEPTTITYRNPDGALTPKDEVSFLATAPGTTTTFVTTDPAAAGVQVGDYFTLQHGALNANTDFTSGTTGWTASGGTLTALPGGVGKMVPNGTSATVSVTSTAVPVTAGATYTAEALLQNDVTRVVNLVISWFNSSSTLISSVTYAVPLAAGLPLFATTNAVAPAGAVTATVAFTMTGTPPVTNIMYGVGVLLRSVNEFGAFQVTSTATVGGTATLTYRRADGVAGGSLGPTAALATYTSASVDLYTPNRVMAVWGGKRHYWYVGWAERWPETWSADDPAGMVEMTATGTLANLTPADNSSLAGEILRRDPYAYWPLSDPAGSPSATNLSGQSVTQLVQKTTLTPGTANGTAEFGSDTQSVQVSGDTYALLGDPGSAWYVHGLTGTEIKNGAGFGLTGTDAGFPPLSGGVSVFAVFQNSDNSGIIASSTINPTIFALKNTDPGSGTGLGRLIRVEYHGQDSTARVTVWDKDTHAATTTVCTLASVSTVSPGGAFDGLTLTVTTTSWSLYGSYGGALLGQGSCNLPATWTTLDVGGEFDQFTHGQCVSESRFAHVAVFGRALVAAEAAQLSAAVHGHDGDEYPANRVQRKTDAINMTAPRALSYGGKKVLAADVGANASVAEAATSIGAYEDALVFEDASAGLQYRPPTVADDQVTVAVLGERSDLGELPYEPGVTASHDASYLYNTSTIANSAGARWGPTDVVTTTSFVAVDQASQQRYGVRTLPRDTKFSHPEDAWGLAYWLRSQYSTRKRRIEQIQLDPAANPALWLFVLTVEVGDLVTVMRRPIGAPDVTLSCVVLQIEHAFDAEHPSWTTTLTLAPARPKTLTLNDPVKGIVGSTVIGLE